MFDSPIIIFTSDADIFFPAKNVFVQAKEIFQKNTDVCNTRQAFAICGNNDICM